jgi:hypothetical protein
VNVDDELRRAGERARSAGGRPSPTPPDWEALARRRRHRHWRLAASSLALVAVVAGATVAATRDGDGGPEVVAGPVDPSTTAAPSTSMPSATTTAPTTASTATGPIADLPDGGVAVAATDGTTAWGLVPASGVGVIRYDRLARRDLATGAITATSEVDDPFAVVPVGGALWVLSSHSTTLTTLDATTLAPVGSPVTLDEPPVAAAGGNWGLVVATAHSVRLRPEGDVAYRVDAPRRITDVAVTANVIFVATVADDGTVGVVSFDPGSGRETARDDHVGGGPGGPATLALASDDLLWVSFATGMRSAALQLRQGDLSLTGAVAPVEGHGYLVAGEVFLWLTDDSSHLSCLAPDGSILGTAGPASAHVTFARQPKGTWTPWSGWQPVPTPTGCPTASPSTFASTVVPFKVFLPSGWAVDTTDGRPTGADRFVGPDGRRATLTRGDTAGIDIDGFVATLTQHVLHPYGSDPTVDPISVGTLDGRLVRPSSDAPQALAALVFPVPDTGAPYRYAIFNTDLDDIGRFVFRPQPTVAPGPAVVAPSDVPACTGDQLEYQSGGLGFLRFFRAGPVCGLAGVPTLRGRDAAGGWYDLPSRPLLVNPTNGPNWTGTFSDGLVAVLTIREPEPASCDHVTDPASYVELELTTPQGAVVTVPIAFDTKGCTLDVTPFVADSQDS